MKERTRIKLGRGEGRRGWRLLNLPLSSAIDRQIYSPNYNHNLTKFYFLRDIEPGPEAEEDFMSGGEGTEGLEGTGSVSLEPLDSLSSTI